jgi:putative membrane protein
MAGMLYLPRLFVYHAMEKPRSMQSKTFKVMERRLMNFIMTPAMITSWAFGIALVVQGGWFADGWFHTKLALVLVMSGLHGFLSSCVRRFACDANTRSEKFYRIVNEIPIVLLIFIVILAVVKPF